MRKYVKYAVALLVLVALLIGKDYLFAIISKFRFENTYEKVTIENEVLKSELNDLKAKMESYEAESDFKITSSYEFVYAKVFLRSPYDFYEKIIIEKGKNAGLKEGMAVVGSEGLVGTIEKVNANTSYVKLLTSNESKISVVVHGSYGILNGYNRENDTLTIKDVTKYAGVSVGDLVYTSNLGALPGGLMIGRVEEIVYDNFEVQKEIRVKLRTNIDKISYVAVLTNINEE